MVNGLFIFIAAVFWRLAVQGLSCVVWALSGRCMDSTTVAFRLGHTMACGILDSWLEVELMRPLHWKADYWPLDQQGSPRLCLLNSFFINYFRMIWLDHIIKHWMSICNRAADIQERAGCGFCPREARSVGGSRFLRAVSLWVVSIYSPGTLAFKPLLTACPPPTRLLLPTVAGLISGWAGYIERSVAVCILPSCIVKHFLTVFSVWKHCEPVAK